MAMFCPKCGKPVGDSLAFCPECSVSLALPGEDHSGSDAQTHQRRAASTDPNQNTPARTGLAVGAGIALLSAVLFIPGPSTDSLGDSITLSAMGGLTFFFLILVWCVGYLTRSSGFGYGGGVGFCSVYALASLVSFIVCAASGDSPGAWVWLVIAAVFGGAVFGFRGLLILRSKRRSIHAPLPPGKNFCPRCGGLTEDTWTTCRQCALPLAVAGVSPGVAKSSEGTRVAARRGVANVITWLTAGW
jgi:hypothetical protein